MPALTQAVFETVLLETRHVVKAALLEMTVKTDRKTSVLPRRSPLDSPTRF
jgi:hypothetical protein